MHALVLDRISNVARRPGAGANESSLSNLFYPFPAPPFRTVVYEHFWVGLKPFSSQSNCYQL